MPHAVKEEILIGGKHEIGVKEFKQNSWLKIKKVSDNDKVKLLYELEQGEAEVIILAREMGIKQVLIDEKVGRLQAKVLGLNVIGTLGLLLRAKNMGILPKIKPLIEEMRDRGIWIKKDIIEGILKEAKEK